MERRIIDKQFHQAEEQLLYYADIHISRNTKYKEGANRILLTKSIKSLYLSDVGYHKVCYDNFLSPSWDRELKSKVTSSDEHIIQEFVNLVEYLVIMKKEIYTLAQLRAHFKETSGDCLRSIDIKSKLHERFKEKILFYKPSHDKTTEFIVSSDSNIMPDTIHAVATGQGITSCLQLKTMACSISEEIQSFPKREWPPTPQVIIESTDSLSKMLLVHRMDSESEFVHGQIWSCKAISE